jgi:putative transposase
MKNVAKLEHYLSPWELERAIEAFVKYYNQDRQHGSLDNVTPPDMYYGRGQTILNRQECTKLKTLAIRKQNHYANRAITQLIGGLSLGLSPTLSNRF